MPRAKKSDKSMPEENNTEKINLLINQIMSTVLGMYKADEIYNKLYPEVEQKFKEKFGCIPQIHSVVDSSGIEHSFSGAVHEMFDTVLNLVNLRIPVFMHGPAGSGKLMYN